MKEKLPSPVTLLVLTIITSVIWVSMSVYRAYTTEPAPSVPNDVSQELSPTLDKQTIEEIKQKQFFNEVPAFAPPATSAPEESATPIPEDEETPIPSEEPTATSSAQPEGGASAN